MRDAPPTPRDVLTFWFGDTDDEAKCIDQNRGRWFGGGDAVLVPSRFEPCGLTQMYGLRYGTIPVVAATGGLNDTVIGATPASLSARAATGVSFHPVDKTAFAGALRQLSRLPADRSGWTSLIKRAMKAEVGWAAPAARYAELYRSLLP